MKRLSSFVKKEFIQFKRDPKMLAMSILAPLLQLIILGYAANFDIFDIPTVIWDKDQSVLSRSYGEVFQSTDIFKILAPPRDYSELVSKLDKGEASLAIIIEEGFQRQLLAGQRPEVAALVDGSDSNTATSGLYYSSLMTQNFASNVQKTGPPLKHAHISPVMRVTYNSDLKSRHFLVPGILGLVLMIITMVLTSLAIVKEKESGTLEQVMVTPVKGWEVIMGKLIPFTIIGIIDILLVIGAAVVVFGIPLKGSFLFLLIMSIIYLISTLGLGLFISTTSETQQQAMLTAVFFIITPMVFLSGFIFPVNNMPGVIRYLTPLLPLKHYLEIIRGIFLRGAGMKELWAPSVWLTLLSVAVFVTSIKMFEKSSQ